MTNEEQLTRSPNDNACRLCGSRDTHAFGAREMMHGTRESFSYFECNSCGAIEIGEIPEDLARFYEHGYYSFAAPGTSFIQRLRRLALRATVSVTAGIPRLREFLRQRFLILHYLFLYDEATRHDRDAAILDVGCGSGQLVKILADTGYRHISGIDPFIAADIDYRGHPLVKRGNIFDVTGTYDVISFHHSLEHMPDQVGTLTQARDILAPHGSIIVRIPVAGSEAWTLYHKDWVQLDPPRHLYLHSLKSLDRVATAAGLKVAKVTYDSTGFQFWGSELYRRDIPLNDPRSPSQNGRDPIFSSREMKRFEYRARAANLAGRGDQITAWLVPVDQPAIDVGDR